MDDLLRRDLLRMGVDPSAWPRLLEGAPGATARLRWAAFLARMLPGDELWSYESTGALPPGLDGTGGYAIVRAATPVETLTSWRG
ncbi:MAG: hypothetical protein U0324_06445 [Polyangiales bacterium]